MKLKLFFDWGIEFDPNNPYTVNENANRKVEYAERKDIVDAVIKAYHPEFLEEPPVDGAMSGFGGGQSQVESRMNEPQTSPLKKTDKRKDGSGGGTPVRTTLPPHKRNSIPREQEAKPDEPS